MRVRFPSATDLPSIGGCAQLPTVVTGTLGARGSYPAASIKLGGRDRQSTLASAQDGLVAVAARNFACQGMSRRGRSRADFLDPTVEQLAASHVGQIAPQRTLSIAADEQLLPALRSRCATPVSRSLASVVA